jgi:hypothetical protein
MRLITLRLEAILKSLVQRMADSSSRNLSEIVRDLIDVGVAYQQEAPVTMRGVFGLVRPLSKLSLGDEVVRFSFYVEESQIGEAAEAFGDTEASSLREAIRLGFIMLNADVASFSSPNTVIQPFKAFKVNNFKSIRANDALTRLSKH